MDRVRLWALSVDDLCTLYATSKERWPPALQMTDVLNHKVFGQMFRTCSYKRVFFFSRNYIRVLMR